MEYTFGAYVFFVVVLEILLFVISNLKKKKKNDFCWNVVFVFLVVLLAFRAISIGTDSNSYYYQFTSDGYLESTSHEWLYIGLRKLIYSFGINESFIIFMILAVLSLGGLISYFKYKNVSPYIGGFITFVLFYAASCNLIRQMIAISFAFYGMKWIEEKKFWCAILFLVIGGLFHTSVFLFLLVYIIYYNREYKATKYIVLLGIVFFVFFYQQFFDIFLSFDIMEKYGRYFSYSVVGSAKFRALTKIPLLIIFLINGLRIKRDNEDSIFFILFLGEFVSLLLGDAVSFAYRLFYYFEPFEVLLVDRVIKYREGIIKKIYVLIFVVYYALYFYIVYYYAGHEGIFQYI